MSTEVRNAPDLPIKNNSDANDFLLGIKMVNGKPVVCRFENVLPSWIKVTKTFEDCKDASQSKAVPIITLPAKWCVHTAIIKHSEKFTGSDNTTPVSGEVIAVSDGNETEYSGELLFSPIAPGSLSITDGVEVFSDNGAGILTGDKGGTGDVNYDTGAWNCKFYDPVSLNQDITADYSYGLGRVTASLGNGGDANKYSGGAPYKLVLTSTVSPSNYSYTRIRYQGNNYPIPTTPESFIVDSEIALFVTSNGDNLDTMTAGSIDCWLLVSKLP